MDASDTCRKLHIEASMQTVSHQEKDTIRHFLES